MTGAQNGKFPQNFPYLHPNPLISLANQASFFSVFPLEI